MDESRGGGMNKFLYITDSNKPVLANTNIILIFIYLFYSILQVNVIHLKAVLV